MVLYKCSCGFSTKYEDHAHLHEKEMNHKVFKYIFSYVVYN